MQYCIKTMTKRMIHNFDRGSYPAGWVDDDEEENNVVVDSEDQEEKLRRAMGGMIMSLYAYHEDIGIIYELNLKKMMKMTRRSQLYAYLDVDPPITGQELIDLDDGNDDFPEPPASHDAWTAFLANGPLIATDIDGSPLVDGIDDNEDGNVAVERDYDAEMAAILARHYGGDGNHNNSNRNSNNRNRNSNNRELMGFGIEDNEYLDDANDVE